MYNQDTNTTSKYNIKSDIKFGQLNMRKAKAASATITQLITDINLDILLLQEPYTIQGKTAGLPVRFPVAELGNDRTKACIMFVNTQIPHHFHKDLSTDNIAVATIIHNNTETTLISAYTEPNSDIDTFLDDMTYILETTKTTHIIISMDSNAHSTIWNSPVTSQRGRKVEEWLATHNYTTLNSGHNPTFDNNRSTSFIDITVTDYQTQAQITQWQVTDQYTASDHKLICFTLDTTITLQPRTTRKYYTTNANWIDFHKTLQENLRKHNINSKTIQETSNSTELDTLVTELMKTITDTCDRKLHQNTQRTTHKHKPNPWWTKELSILRNRLKALKRQVYRTHTPEIKTIRKQHYRTLERQYKKLILQEKQTTWRKYCTLDIRNPFINAYKLVKRKFKRTPIQEPFIDNNNKKFTDISIEAAHILHTFFGNNHQTHPNQSKITNTDRHDTIEDITLTEQEISLTIKHKTSNKAPGQDGVDNIILLQIHKRFTNLITTLYQTCFKHKMFPTVWKQSLLILIPKPNKKQYNTTDSYRPICLLSAFGKIYEKLIKDRITYHLYTTDCLHKHQYGFIRTKNTSQPTQILANMAEEALKNQGFCAAITLDIKGAFNNVQHHNIITSLHNTNMPHNITEIIRDFMRNRQVHLHWKGTTSTIQTDKGCPQGSALSPTLWIINMNSLLQESLAPGVVILLFADDILLVSTDKDPTSLEHKINNSLKTIHTWTTAQQLTFSYHKCTGILITRKLKYSTPIFKLDNHIIPLHKHIKYLGITIDSKLTWHVHIKNITNIAKLLIHNLNRIAHNTWGAPPQALHTIHKQVITPIITYNSHIWSDALNYKYNRVILRRTERQMALLVTKAYRSTSYEAAMALAGLTPLAFNIRQSKTLQDVLRQGTYTIHKKTFEIKTKTPNTDIPHPALPTLSRSEEEDGMPEVEIYTDGSKTDAGVGAGLHACIHRNNTQIIHNKSYKLPTHNTIYNAELYAIKQAVKFILTLDTLPKTTTIYTDSLSSIYSIINRDTDNRTICKIIHMNATLQLQNSLVTVKWVRGHSGVHGNHEADTLAKKGTTQCTRLRHNYIPISYLKTITKQSTHKQWAKWYNTDINFQKNIKKIFPTFQHLQIFTRTHTPNYYTTQIITAHGNFNSYLYKRTLTQSPNCNCDHTTLQTPEHLLLHCPEHISKRTTLTRHLQRSKTPNTLQGIFNNNTKGIHILTTLMKDIIDEIKQQTNTPQSQTTNTQDT